MNISIFTDTYLPKIDGISLSTSRFAELLAERGHQISICCPRYHDTDIFERRGNIRIYRFENAPLPSYPDIKLSLPSGRMIKDAIEGVKADLIHIQTPGLLGHYGIFAAGYYRLPVIGTYHTLVSEQGTYISPYRLLRLDSLIGKIFPQNPLASIFTNLKNAGEEFFVKPALFAACNVFYNMSDVIVSPSESIRNELIRAGISRRIEVISNGIDLEKFRGSPKRVDPSRRALLYTGRLSFEKNCNVLIDAFRIILDSVPNATLDFIGEGPAEEELKNRIAELAIQNSVRFLGLIPHEELPALYDQYDLFLTASTMETQGLAVLEACAMGLPCVAVRERALPDLVQDGINGFCVDPFSPQQMAEAALSILKDPEKYNAFSSGSIEIASGHDVRACAQRLELLYSEMASIKK
jgi:glycosyltransferase involved in cell wall biosynthesis